MNNEIKKMIERAYRILKKTAFYDKTMKTLKDDLAYFEEQASVDGVSTFIESKIRKDWSNFVKEEDINFLLLPKKVEKKGAKKIDNNDVIMSNEDKNLDDFEIEYQIFADFKPEIHILGIVWCMLIGCDIDATFYDQSFGNRIQRGSKNKKSDRLFIPYYIQYESWQTKAYKKAIDLLSSNKDCYIVTLDVARFYYCLNENLSCFKNKVLDLIKKHLVADKKYNFAVNVNEQIFKVIKIFNDKVSKRLEEIRKQVTLDKSKMFALPISFAPSNILANLYLNEWDSIVFEKIRPAFYGRYVDDMIFVFDSKNVNNQKKKNKNELLNELLGKHIKIQDNCYYICKDSKNIGEINKDKLKIMFFNHNYRHDVIDEIVDFLDKNKSIFNYMDEEDLEYKTNKFHFFQYENNKEVSKFNSMCENSVDKFKFTIELSNMLTKVSLISAKDNIEDIKEIIKVLNPIVLLQNYQTIEKVSNIILTCIEYDDTIYNLFLAKIDNMFSSLENIDFIECLARYVFVNLKLSFMNFVGTKVKNEYDKVFKCLSKYCSDFRNNNGYVKYKEIYSRALYFDKTNMPFLMPLLNVFNNKYLSYQGDYLRLTSYDECINYFIEGKENIIIKLDNAIIPFFIHIYELDFLNMLIGQSNKNSIDILKKSKSNEYVKDKISYQKIRTSLDLDMHNFELLEIKIDDAKMRKCKKIGIANIHKDICEDNIFSFKNCHDIKHLNVLSEIFNKSIKDHVDFLVLPELYLPPQWLIYVVKFALKSKISIICGLEYIKINNKIYNYIISILPFSNERFRSATAVYHLKMNYSPHEEQKASIYGYKLIVGKQLELVNYNNFYYKMLCCYEFTNMKIRMWAYSYIDATFIIEYNKYINYFDNIISSYTRDMHCYCVQVNDSYYGDSRVTAPKGTVERDYLKVKGGCNSTILSTKIDIKKIRDFQCLPILAQDPKVFKNTPPNFNGAGVSYRNDNK